MTAEALAAAGSRLGRITLEQSDALSRLAPVLVADHVQAVRDLLAENRFAPSNLPPGPYALRLSIQQGRMVFDIRTLDDAPLTAIGLALGPFRRLISDYQMLVDSHIRAAQENHEERVQAIDWGRRGLHNEGAELMVQRLQGKVAIDFDTARRLFTLICVLHRRI
jgi:uncharacterized protein (UPF0262 family)